MNSLHALLLELVEGLPGDAGSPADGVAVRVDTVDLALPIELRFDGRGHVGASLPRNRLATGFDAPLSKVTALFVRRDP